MRVWIDMTASAHPLVFRPLVQILEARGDEVEITARDYGQTLQLIEAHAGVPEVAIAWQGGEPTLMGVDFFRRSVELAYERFHDYERTMAVNYFGAVRLILALMPAMQASKSNLVRTRP